MLDLIGRFQVQERIGEGAMADVYRAHDPSIRRALAIKVLKGQYRENPEYSSRFLREAKAAGALSHPNIVTIYDVGEAEGYPYIAMELVEGQPLDVAIHKKALPPEQVIAIGAQLAEALAYAHDAGVVHRDIKPSNILVGTDLRSVKILDFGIARIAESNGVHDAESLKTQVGQVMGTPRYMSPEQVMGEAIDGRSDLFSLGVILYEMTTGRRAFDGANAGTLALQIIKQDPRPIAELAPQAHAGLEFIIAKLLAKKPERRYATGAELAKALRREQTALSAAAGEAKAPRFVSMQVRLTVVMVCVTALALIATISVVWDRQYKAMERMALSSGAAITTFVASNAALSVAENAGLPQAEQDWAPVAAFVHGAAMDPNVRQVIIADASGVVQAATNPRLVGRGYVAPARQGVPRWIGQVSVSEAAGDRAGPAFRFVRPVVYSGRQFGFVDVTVSKSELIAAALLSKWLLAALAAVVLAVVGAVSYVGARLLAGPVKRLKVAMDNTAGLIDGVRISHKRRDEFGQLFDSFNRLSATVHAVRESSAKEPEATVAVVETQSAPAAFAPAALSQPFIEGSAEPDTPSSARADEDVLLRTVLRR